MSERLPTAISVAVSAWQIVFAAVVAQAFKTYATWRVERGIKLMDLEELVGSNSFANVMKQPILLRRLTLLTPIIFITWCLSQSLLQMAVLSLHASFMPPGLGELTKPTSPLKNRPSDSTIAFEDRYNHPYVSYPYDVSPAAQTRLNATNDTDWALPYYASACGLPVVLPDSLLGSDPDKMSSKAKAKVGSEYEQFNFTTTTSSWEFYGCSNWEQVKYSDIDHLNFSMSVSGTLGLKLTTIGDGLGVNHMQYLTLVDQTNDTDFTECSADHSCAGPNWQYMYTECDFHQIFLSVSMSCYASSDGTIVDQYGSSVVFNCADATDYGDIYHIPKIAPNVTDQAASHPEWITNLADISYPFVKYATPFGGSYDNVTSLGLCFLFAVFGFTVKLTCGQSRQWRRMRMPFRLWRVRLTRSTLDRTRHIWRILPRHTCLRRILASSSAHGSTLDSARSALRSRTRTSQAIMICSRQTDSRP